MPDAPPGPPDVILEGAFDRAHEKRYTHRPFTVPEGVRALHVRYTYTDPIPADPRLGGGNTLDIGLFDPRGIAPSSPGFRGWSGSGTLAFTVAEAWATPPYVPGPIQPGIWHVLLGPYKVGPRGCTYRVEVRFDDDPGVAEPRPREVRAQPLALPAPDEPGWLRGDLHCHTRHSDGDSWPADMLACAVEAGLDFLGVTDHNTVSHHADYASVRGAHLPILLPGVEVTTYGGHWNVWGTDTWWEFREPTEAAVSQAMCAAAATGALVSVNHPKPFGPPWEYPGALGYHAIEVWNGHWQRLNGAALAWWEAQLRAGRRIVAVGGSDTHHLTHPDPDPRHGAGLGRPTTWVEVGDERTPAAVLAALRAGRAFISAGPDGPRLYLRPGEAPGTVAARVVGGRRAGLLLVDEQGVCAAASVAGEDWSDTFALPPECGRGYVRAQVADAAGDLLALSNPLYPEPRP